MWVHVCPCVRLHVRECRKSVLVGEGAGASSPRCKLWLERQRWGPGGHCPWVFGKNFSLCCLLPGLYQAVWEGHHVTGTQASFIKGPEVTYRAETSHSSPWKTGQHQAWVPRAPWGWGHQRPSEGAQAPGDFAPGLNISMWISGDSRKQERR